MRGIRGKEVLVEVTESKHVFLFLSFLLFFNDASKSWGLDDTEKDCPS